MTSVVEVPTLGPAGEDRFLAKLRDPSSWADWASGVGLVLVFVVFSILSPTFLTMGNLEAILAASAILMLLVIGQTFVISTAGIDLSIAANLTLGAVVLGQLQVNGVGTLGACVGAVATTAACGAANGLVITKGKVPDFIATLGMLSVATGAALVLADGLPQQVNSDALFEFSSGSIGILAYPVVAALIVALGAHFTLFHTRFGLHVWGTGGNADSVHAMGVSTSRVKLAVYTISGACAGLAAILMVARLGVAEPVVNQTYLLNAIAAVVLGGVSLFGGKGSVRGPFLGAILLTSLVNGLTLVGISQFFQPLAVGVVVVLAALVMRYEK